MHDVLPFISSVLSDTGAQIELAENEFSAELPLITLMEVSNTAAIITDGVEQFSDVSVQLDIYDFTPEAVKKLAGVVSSKLVSVGFRRVQGQLMKEENLWRYMLTFDCSIDAECRIYSGYNS